MQANLLFQKYWSCLKSSWHIDFEDSHRTKGSKLWTSLHCSSGRLLVEWCPLVEEKHLLGILWWLAMNPSFLRLHNLSWRETSKPKKDYGLSFDDESKKHCCLWYAIGIDGYSDFSNTWPHLVPFMPLIVQLRKKSQQLRIRTLNVIKSNGALIDTSWVRGNQATLLINP